MEVTSTEIQNNFGTYLKLAQVEEVFVTRNGKKIAVLKFWNEMSGEFLNAAERGGKYQNDRMRISAEEFLKLTASSDNRYELIDGQIYQLASPSYEHQRILGEIFNQFHHWLQEKKCKLVMAPFDVILFNNDLPNIVQPDLIIICDSEKIDGQGKYNGIPALVVEILSETTRSKDMLTKLNLYMGGGVKEYWIVSPWSREIYIYNFESCGIQNYRVFKGSEYAGAGILQGLNVPLEKVFPME